MNKTCFCSYERQHGMFDYYGCRDHCRCDHSSYSPSTKVSAPKNRNSKQLLTAKLAKRGASGTLRHVTPVIVRQPSLIERIGSKVSTSKLFSLVAVLAVASWIWG